MRKHAIGMHGTPTKKARVRFGVLVLVLFVVALTAISIGLQYDTHWMVEVGSFVGVSVVVHLLYYFLIAEQHKAEISELLATEIQGLGTAAGFCKTFGIDSIVGRDEQPLNRESLGELQSGDKVVCVGRTLCQLLRCQKSPIAEAIIRGVDIELCMCDYNYCLQAYERHLMNTSVNEYRIFFDVLVSMETDLARLAKTRQCKGTLTLYFHQVYLPDTLLAFHLKNGQNVAYWIPSFGTQGNDKVTFKLVQGLGGAKLHEALEQRFNRVLCDQVKPEDGVRRNPVSVFGKKPTGSSAQELQEAFEAKYPRNHT